MAMLKIARAITAMTLQIGEMTAMIGVCVVHRCDLRCSDVQGGAPDLDKSQSTPTRKIPERRKLTN